MAKTRHAIPTSAQMVAEAVTERELQDNVLRLADLFGWRAYHTFDSRRSQRGFPDLVLVRGGRLIFAELKTEKGDASAHQAEWLADLGTCSGVEVHLWRPSDMDDVEAALR